MMIITTKLEDTNKTQQGYFASDFFNLNPFATPIDLAWFGHLTCLLLIYNQLSQGCYHI